MFLMNQVSQRRAMIDKSVVVLNRLLTSSEDSLYQSSMKPVASNKDLTSYRKSHRPQRVEIPSTERTKYRKKAEDNLSQGKHDACSLLPRVNWIKLDEVPPLATLEDITDSVNRILDIENTIGIVDIDAIHQNEDGSFPRLKLDPSEPWVKSAQVVLSTHARPTSWVIELGNRSIVNAFLQHTKENGFHCAWKESVVREWNKETERTFCDPLFDIDDNVVRVENCCEKVTPNLLRTIFRHYDLSRFTPNICCWENEYVQKNYKIFLLRFDSASWARAAIRDMQGVTAYEMKLRLAQYPKQLLNQASTKKT